jgi:protein O-GlcNAc transferase
MIFRRENNVSEGLVPSFLEGEIRKAQFLAKQGAVDQAKQLFRAVLEKDPQNEQARDELAALNIRSAQFGALTALFEEGDLAAVLEKGETLSRQYPESAFLYNTLGTTNAKLRRLEPAIACYTKAVQIRPDIAAAHNNLGKVLSEASRRDEAISCFHNALRIKPDYADAHYNLGIVFHAASRLDEAIGCFTKALHIIPAFAEANSNLGVVLRDAGRYEEAIVCFIRSLQINPDAAATHIHLSTVYNRLARYPEAIASLTEALKIDPDLTDARAQRLFLRGMICDWGSLFENADVLSTLGLSGNALRPFVMLSLDDDPAHHRTRSEIFAKERWNQPELALIARAVTKPARLRIGYFSADFHNHAVLFQIIRLLELHDRTRFQVIAYSYGPPANDAMRARSKAAADIFRDVHSLGGKDIAELARKDRIDIAIDLMGHTENARSDIFAYRAAPVQISYLGYPGTMGSASIDYMIADRILIPEELKKHYCEKIIYLPNSHMATDNRREISNRPVTRAEMGLPESGFVFCCFNNSFKISPAEFDVWMRLLGKVEGSVLWLVNANPWVRSNLGKEAQSRNIDPERVIFAERVPMADHLARHQLADLFLDTFNYNGHSTASDALWAGLPVVTRPGQGFAARVAASLLTAIGLPELIASSTEEYEELALELATNPRKLTELKKKLLERRKESPLFESEQFARYVEDAYEQAYGRYFDGKEPEDIVVLAR